MSELATIERMDVEITATGWQPTGEMSFEDWCEAGQKLGQIAEAVQWWIGDWINYGATTYGHKYKEALEATGYEYGSLANMAAVAEEFESSRRRENLSWSHHADVASLAREQQDAVLDRAASEGWTRAALRDSLSGNSNGNGRKGKGVTSDLTSSVVVGARTLTQTFNNKQLKRRTEEALIAHAEDVGYL